MHQRAVSNICGLEAGFVPHRQWPLRKWYFANPLWFYHKQYAVDEMIPSPTFYELVDPDLRELCRGLHDAGLHTTPSCQGHFYGRERFVRIWAELEREREAIVSGGLPVTDSETQEQRLFRDDSFALPWACFDDFHAEAGAQQGIGYLGVLVPPQDDDLCERLGRLAHAGDASQIEYDDAIGGRLGARLLAIQVSPRTPRQRRELWRGITGSILSAVREAAGRPRARARAAHAL